MNNKWTDEEIEIIKQNYKDLTDEELTQLLPRRTLSSVKTKRKDLKLIKDKAHRKYSFKDVEEAFKNSKYILLSKENEYIDAARNTLRYLCPDHLDKGEMKISFGHFINGRGCYYCGREITESAHIISDKVLNESCKILCENKGFIYMGFERINGKIYINYICPNHQEIGIQKMTKGNMNRDNITACPYCVDNKKYKFSKGEQMIAKYLDDNNILYIRQFKFDTCKDIHVLPFDFYLLDYRIAIEFDGQHHFKPVTFNGISKEEAIKNHQTTVYHDKIKNQYCVNNQIGLIRIPYYEFKNIKQIINERIKHNNI